MVRGTKPALLGLVRSVQSSYPQIYLACHVDHIRRRDHVSQLSSSDAAILAHLSFDPATTLGALARHLGIAPSSLSARIKHLETLGHINRVHAPADRRVTRLELTQKGVRAASAASVLDEHRVTQLLERLPATERLRAIEGMALLASAAAGMIWKRTPS